jgi:hypothetical protein
MKPFRVDEIITDVELMRNQAWPLSKLVEIRHKLTDSIDYNLYGSGSKEEGSKALSLRNCLDEAIHKVRETVEGDTDAIEHFKLAIALEKCAEKLQILERIAKSAKGSRKAIKHHMADILRDTDRLQRFLPKQQNTIKLIACGTALLSAYRFNLLMNSEQNIARNLAKLARR